MKNAILQTHAPILSIFLLLLIVVCPLTAFASLHLAPDAVHINTFFAGEQVQVSGMIPRGSNAILEVIGKRIEEQLLRKGRHWDIWMNVGEIDIENAPCLYLALSTDPKSFSQTKSDIDYGYSALKKKTTFLGDKKGLAISDIFKEFVDLKESEKLYGLFPGALKISDSQGNESEIEGSFRIPSRIDPGNYQVRLSIIDHGKILSSETSQLTVGMVGLPAFLSSLAQDHGSLYGLLAIGIAIIFGFGVGTLFRKRAH